MSLIEYVMSGHWAMEPATLERMIDVIERHAEGHKLSTDEIESRIKRSRGANPIPEMRIEDGVATIPIHGVIARHASAVGDVSSPRGTSPQQIRADLRAAMGSPEVDHIVLDVDSPGGSVAGIADLADEVAAADKPVTAYVRDLMASAAYWIASGADKIVAAQTARVGSIGVYAVVHDTHHRDHAEGITRTVVSSGRVKGGGAGGHVTGDQIANTREIVENLAQIFLGSVEARRGLSPEQMDAIKDGSVYVAEDAHRHGLVDEIASMDDVLAECRSKRSMAEDVNVDVVATDMEEAPMSEDTPSAEDYRAQDIARLQALRDALPAEDALEAYLAGQTVAEAKAARFDQLQADLAAEREQHARTVADLELARTTRTLGNQPVGQAEAPIVETDPREIFEARIDEFCKQTGGDRLKATGLAVRKHGDEYRAYLAAVNGLDKVEWPPRRFRN